MPVMGRIQTDPSVMTGLPEWLEETLIPVPEIEAFKQQLEEIGPAERLAVPRFPNLGAAGSSDGGGVSRSRASRCDRRRR
jgi:hypothetical protein